MPSIKRMYKQALAGKKIEKSRTLKLGPWQLKREQRAEITFPSKRVLAKKDLVIKSRKTGRSLRFTKTKISPPPRGGKVLPAEVAKRKAFQGRTFSAETSTYRGERFVKVEGPKRVVYFKNDPQDLTISVRKKNAKKPKKISLWRRIDV